jgi:hypothetical protein
MKRKELVEIYLTYKEIKDSGEKLPFKVIYTMNKNLKTMSPEVESIQEVEKALVESKKGWETKRLEIIKKYAELDGDGNPKVEGDKYVIPKIDEAMKEIDSVFKEGFKDSTEKAIKDYEEILDGEITLDLMKHSLDDVKDIKMKYSESFMLVVE